MSTNSVIGIAFFSFGFLCATLLVYFLPGDAICDRCSKNTGTLCDCTVNWNNHSIPIEDAIEQIGEGLQELNDSFEIYCQDEN